MQNLDTIIKVGAVFSAEGAAPAGGQGSASGGRGSQIIPKWFVWEKRRYDIKEINYFWNDTKGIEQLHCFSVTDGVNSYEISFNSKRTVWKLNKIYGGS